MNPIQFFARIITVPTSDPWNKTNGGLWWNYNFYRNIIFFNLVPLGPRFKNIAQACRDLPRLLQTRLNPLNPKQKQENPEQPIKQRKSVNRGRDRNPWMFKAARGFLAPTGCGCLYGPVDLLRWRALRALVANILRDSLPQEALGLYMVRFIFKGRHYHWRGWKKGPWC